MTYLSSPLRWIGGKRRLRKQIIPLLPRHLTYVEVFGGAGWVLFGKEPSAVEVYNDVNGELINFFRVVQNSPKELLEVLRWKLHSRELFMEYRDTGTEAWSSVQRAARFLYLVRASYGVDMKSLGYGFRQRPGYNPAALYALIAQAHHRLARVYIERLDFRDLILRYDRPTTLFYLDPPYPGLNKTGYEGGLMEEDHRELAALLQTVKGKWVLSYSDCPLVQDLYRDFEDKRYYGISYTMSRAGAKRRDAEVLIRNTVRPSPIPNPLLPLFWLHLPRKISASRSVKKMSTLEELRVRYIDVNSRCKEGQDE